MITSQIRGNEDKEIKYPLLARLKANKDLIVLFSKPRCGMVVAHHPESKHPAHNLGVFADDWNDISNWEILPNDFKIILQNTDI
ncbi:MAG: hypothetical protein RSB94_07735 [Erysipelotrichaceae bacterium]